jgi:carbamoyltransferase
MRRTPEMRRNIYVLGIDDGHDASVAVTKNGRIVAALAEERLRNIKHYAGVPEMAIGEALKIAQIGPQDIDLVAISGYNVVQLIGTARMTHKLASQVVPLSPLIEQFDTVRNLAVKFLHLVRPKKGLFRVLAKYGLSNKEIIFVEHHRTHAATAYRLCPWDDDTLIFTSDFVGDYISSEVSIGRKNEIVRIKNSQSTFSNTMGGFYTEITRYLGMRAFDEEYKLMGLAPYGNPKYVYPIVKRFIQVSDKKPLQFKNLLGWHITYRPSLVHQLLQFQRFDNIAAAAQKLLEDLFYQLVHNAIELTDIHNVAFSGGSFLNVKANQKIREMPEVNRMFVFPAASDDGTSVGAALEGYAVFCKRDGIKVEKEPLHDMYLGSAFSSEEIERTIKSEGLWKNAAHYDDVDGVAGELVAKKKIIARCKGQMEFGPRALGNRSILCDASDWTMVKKVNETIKQRTWWMPFAPTILNERIDYYLIDGEEAPYMIMAFDTTDKRKEIVAATHPQDLTARPQTLREDTNPSYYRLLKAFEETAGFGGFMNTSFNLHGYPIVWGPRQAIWTLKNSALDGLVLGDYLILRNH